MPKPNKRAKQSRDAIRKRWKKMEIPNETFLSQDELSDAEPDIIDESQFNTFWAERVI